MGYGVVHARTPACGGARPEHLSSCVHARGARAASPILLAAEAALARWQRQAWIGIIAPQKPRLLLCAGVETVIGHGADARGYLATTGHVRMCHVRVRALREGATRARRSAVHSVTCCFEQSLWSAHKTWRQ